MSCQGLAPTSGQTRIQTQDGLQHVNFPGGSDGKASVYNAGDPGSTPGSRRSPEEGNGNPLQHACLGNPIDLGAWCPTVELDMTE